MTYGIRQSIATGVTHGIVHGHEERHGHRTETVAAATAEGPMMNEEQLAVLMRVDARTELLAQAMEDLQHCIHGNGREGLVAKVARIEERTIVLEEPRRDRWSRVGAYLAGLGIGATLVIEIARLLHG